jgi:hypothetical protein
MKTTATRKISAFNYNLTERIKLLRNTLPLV